MSSNLHVRAPELIDLSSLIHTFPSSSSESPSAITSLVQSPAIDVVGVGYADGAIHVVDIKEGEAIMQLKQDDGGVTGLAFRLGELDNSTKEWKLISIRWSSRLGKFVHRWVGRDLGLVKGRKNSASPAHGA